MPGQSSPNSQARRGRLAVGSHIARQIAECALWAPTPSPSSSCHCPHKIL